MAEEKLELKTKKDKKSKKSSGGSYFSSPKKNIRFIPTGCTTLDCVIGGGWALGRISNIVGDKATGKTLLAMEACSNFIKDYPEGKIWYVESESAFEPEYAKALGLDVNKINFIQDIYTVEDFFKTLESAIKSLNKGEPGFFVLDSLDALSDDAEIERDIDSPSYAMNKQKKLSELFRRLNNLMGKSGIHLQIISQVRHKIGMAFGRKFDRSGGKSLDFYASQVIYLSHTGQIMKTINTRKRAVGVKIKAKCDKNKVGLPFRDCEFQIEFGYGIDDVTASLNWLLEVKMLDKVPMTQKECKDLIKKVKNMGTEEYNGWRETLKPIVIEGWYEIEKSFIPTRSKY